MKKYFVTGLVILLPLALTIAIVLFIFNLLTEPFVDLFEQLLTNWGLMQILGSTQLQRLAVQLMILALIFFFTVFLGMIARWFFIHYLLRLSDYVFQSIPFIRTVYKTIQHVMKTIFASESRSFKQAVLVKFPNPDTHTIGLVTNEEVPNVTGNSSKMIAVFVPTTPNPTSGFLMLFKQEEVIYLEMPVEDALKYIISCGMIITPFTPLERPPEKKEDEQTPQET